MAGVSPTLGAHGSMGTPIIQQPPQPSPGNLQDLQKQMVGGTNYEELKQLCDQTSQSGSGPMDISKVEKLLLAVQAEAAAKRSL